MARLVYLMMCLLLFTGLLFGCSENIPLDNTAPEVPETIPPYIMELMDSFPEAERELPDQILYETDEYIYYRENGICYISFRSGNHQIECDFKDAPTYSPVFHSMEEKYQWFCAPEITAAHEASIRYWNTLDEENGFIFQDRDRLYTAEFPDEYDLNRTSLENSLVLQTHERLESGRYGGCNVAVVDKDSFASSLSHYYRFQLGNASFLRSYKDPVINADVYEYERNNWLCRTVQYCRKTETKTVFIEENYILAKEFYTSEDYHLSEITVFGYDNGHYFSMSPFYSDPELLPELANEIKIIPYTPE